MNIKSFKDMKYDSKRSLFHSLGKKLYVPTMADDEEPMVFSYP